MRVSVHLTLISFENDHQKTGSKMEMGFMKIGQNQYLILSNLTKNDRIEIDSSSLDKYD